MSRLGSALQWVQSNSFWFSQTHRLGQLLSEVSGQALGSWVPCALVLRGWQHFQRRQLDGRQLGVIESAGDVQRGLFWQR